MGKQSEPRGANGNPSDPRTVFVRGVAPDAQEEALIEAFSAVGPVRHAFLVRSGKQGRHKGYGFVQYALEEDAERAVQEINGVALCGRRLAVEGAFKRAPLEERKGKRRKGDEEKEGQDQGNVDKDAAVDDTPRKIITEQEVAAAKKQTVASLSPAKPPPEVVAEKHALVRTVAVGGLTPESANALVAMVKTAEPRPESATHVSAANIEKQYKQYKLAQDGCFGEVVMLRYASAKDAMAAVAKLHGTELPAETAPLDDGKGRKSKIQKASKRLASASTRLWVRQVSGEGLHMKRWRLVVRNLSFKATEEDISKAFAPAGFVWELTLPRSADGRSRGFAFVGFTCRAHAERGIAIVNGTRVAGRPVAVDWSVSKRDFEATNQAKASTEGTQGDDVEQKREVAMEEFEESEDDEKTRNKTGSIHGGDVDVIDVELAPEEERGMLRSVVDDILGEGEGQQRNGGDQSEDQEPQASDDDEIEADVSEAEEDEEVSLEDGTRGSSSDEAEEVEDGAAETSSETEGGEDGGALGQGKMGRAITKHDQENKATAARDPFSREAAQEASKAPAVQRLEEMAARLAGLATVARKDNSVVGGGNGTGPLPQTTVFVRGLALDVTKEQLFSGMRAYGPIKACRLVLNKATGKPKGTAFVEFRTQDAAMAAAEACQRGRAHQGSGVLIARRSVEVDVALDGSAARSLASTKAGLGGSGQGDTDRRNLYLCKEGAIVEGSSAWEELSESDKAKRARALEESRSKLRSPNFRVSSTRLSVRNVPRTWDEPRLKKLFVQAVKRRATLASPRVVQVKILHEDGVAGKGAGRSKGIAFVEFEEHEHALCALRELNNNPETWGKDHRPIIEFAIDDVKALKKREERLSKQKLFNSGSMQPAREPKNAEGGAVHGGDKHKRPKATGSEASDGKENETETKPAMSKRKLRQERRMMLKKLKRQQQGKTPASSAQQEGADAAAAKSKAARRREQRKRKKQGGDDGEHGAVEERPLKLPKTMVRGDGAVKVAAKGTKGAGSSKAARLDALVDGLATGGEGGENIEKKRKTRTRETDRLDKLADEYVRKLGSSGAKGTEERKKVKRRWFD